MAGILYIFEEYAVIMNGPSGINPVMYGQIWRVEM